VNLAAASKVKVRVEGLAPEFVGRLARVEVVSNEASAEVIASVGRAKVLASDDVDAASVAARLEARREELRSEVKRAEGKLGNERFVERAPAEVVEEERQKLERYRAELEELSE
jgi:valyl-tRNA synthetase